MTSSAYHFVQCLGPHGFHRMAYRTWGDPQNPHLIVCVHGLSRNSHDLDFIAPELAEDAFVVCPDIVGRGASDWLKRKRDYDYPLYVQDMVALLARVGQFAKTIDWVGTSMGGIIGMLFASQVKNPIRRLVVNDIGPHIPKETLQRIGEFLGVDPFFSDEKTAENFIRTTSPGFGNLTDAQWQYLTKHSLKPFENGFKFKFDPGIATTFAEYTSQDADLWPFWDRIHAPVLLLRGTESDLLLPDTVEQMKRRGPKTLEVVEFPNVGHPPMLLNDEQISVVKRFLFSE